MYLLAAVISQERVIYLYARDSDSNTFNGNSHGWLCSREGGKGWKRARRSADGRNSCVREGARKAQLEDPGISLKRPAALMNQALDLGVGEGRGGGTNCDSVLPRFRQKASKVTRDDSSGPLLCHATYQNYGTDKTKGGLARITFRCFLSVRLLSAAACSPCKETADRLG